MTKQITGGVAVLEKEGKHFLVRQSKNKPLGGQWRHPGGSFLKGERDIDGVTRELKEEVGLDVDVIDKKPIHIEKIDYKPGYFGFYMAVVKRGALNIDKREIDDWGWFSLKEIKKLNLMKATRSFYKKKYFLK